MSTKYLHQKTTLVLSNQHTAWLDDISVKIRYRTGAAVSRSSLVRAMIEAMNEVRIDLSACTSEQAVREKILACLNSGRR